MKQQSFVTFLTEGIMMGCAAVLKAYNHAPKQLVADSQSRDLVASVKWRLCGEFSLNKKHFTSRVEAMNFARSLEGKVDYLTVELVFNHQIMIITLWLK